MAKGNGTKGKPWVLKTPSGGSTFEAYRDESADPPALVVQVGKTQLKYHLRAIDDLHAMLKKHGDWMLLGSVDEQKPVKYGTVEAWGDRARIPSKDGTDSRKVSGDALLCTSRRCSRSLV